MMIIDALGKPCPIPVVEAKKVLQSHPGTAVMVMVDNFAAVENLKKMALGYVCGFSYIERSKDNFEVTIDCSAAEVIPNTPAINQLQHAVNANESLHDVGEVAVVIGRNTMGAGAEELGKILIKGFIYSLSELETPPNYLIFFNSGAFLTSRDSNTIDDLKKLEAKGTKIQTCGTCINFYELGEKLAIGEVVNMYDITEVLVSSSKIINI